MDIKIDGTIYAVGIAAVSRRIRRTEKYRVTTEDGVVHREVKATYIDFTLSLGNVGQAAYDALIAALRASTEDMTVELPSASTGVEIYTGVFDGIGDSIANDDGTTVIWDSLSLAFTGTVPQVA